MAEPHAHSQPIQTYGPAPHNRNIWPHNSRAPPSRLADSFVLQRPFYSLLSHVRHLPHDHGISVTPSGLLPSSLVRPNGSFLEGMLALFSDLHIMSFRMLCRCCLPAFFLQARPWSPLASTLSPQ